MKNGFFWDDVLEELKAYFIRVTIIGELETLAITSIRPMVRRRSCCS
jgi:hypothetical protein